MLRVDRPCSVQIARRLVERFEISQSASLDYVGAGCFAVKHVIGVHDLDKHFSLGFFADGQAPHLIILETCIDADNTLQSIEYGVDRPIANGRITAAFTRDQATQEKILNAAIA